MNDLWFSQIQGNAKLKALTETSIVKLFLNSELPTNTCFPFYSWIHPLILERQEHFSTSVWASIFRAHDNKEIFHTLKSPFFLLYKTFAKVILKRYATDRKKWAKDMCKEPGVKKKKSIKR